MTELPHMDKKHLKKNQGIPPFSSQYHSMVTLPMGIYESEVQEEGSIVTNPII